MDTLGIVDSRCIAAGAEITDAMLKAADVDLVSYENVGSTLVTVMVSGDVAAVRAFALRHDERGFPSGSGCARALRF